MKEGWEVKKLGDLAKTSAGGTPLKSKKEYYEGGNIPWLLSGEVAQTEIRTSVKYITEAGLQNSSAKLFPPESVLVAMYGATAGQVGILKFEASTNQAVCGIFPQQNLLSKYTYFFFLHHKADLLKQAVGNAQPNISQAKIKNTLIPVPPLAEQEAIVEVLDKVFAAIDQAKANIEQNIANAKELFQSKLNAIFDCSMDNGKGIMDNSTAENSQLSTVNSPLRKGWVETTLGDYYDVRDGTHDSPKYHEIGYPLITSKNLKFGEISFDKIKFISEEDYHSINKRSAVDVGDVLFAMIGTIGNPVLITEKVNFAIKNVALFKPRNPSCGLFLKFFLDYSTPRMNQEAKGTTQRFVGLGYLRKFPVFMPALPEQENIASKIQAVKKLNDQSISTYQTKLASLDELKKSILQKAFSGQLTD